MNGKIYTEWLKRENDSELSEEIRDMKADEKRKEECFSKNPEFGTGGLRGILGAGTNRMNIRTVARATFGLATYLVEKKVAPSVAVAYDTRNKSKTFALLDADRVGVVVKDGNGYRYLTGNETGVLPEKYILSKKRERKELTENSVVIKTIVTTETARKIADSYGVKTIDVLAGFKYIGERIDGLDRAEDYVFGMEESYGYLVGTHARDKDAISAIMSVVEMAAYYEARENAVNCVGRIV